MNSKVRAAAVCCGPYATAPSAAKKCMRRASSERTISREGVSGTDDHWTEDPSRALHSREKEAFTMTAWGTSVIEAMETLQALTVQRVVEHEQEAH
jgi:hypothetical protein